MPRSRRPERGLRLTRRQVLAAGAAATALGCPAGPRTLDPQPWDHARRVAFAPTEVPESSVLFPQTVSAGAMTQRSVRLWTRAEGAGAVTLRVWRDLGSTTEVALVHEEAVEVPDHGNVQVPVDGLAPATWYRYAFFPTDLSARSPIGRVRTAFPDDWEEPLTIGATSCAAQRHAPFQALVRQAEQPMDLWLHLGDVSYNDGATTLADYREKWRAQLADPGYRALLPAAGGYYVWDDHDFFNNFDPEATGPDDEVVRAATQTWFESLPVERDAEGRTWRSYRWGRTAELFLLDCRTERRPSTRETPQARYLSPEQLAWLTEGLRASPCHFKVVLNSVPITELPPPLWGGQADRWQGYPAAREALLGALEAGNVRNVWFVTGDIHLGLIMRVERAGPRARYLEVAAGPAGNVNPLALVLEPGQEANRAVAFPPDQFLFASGGFLATTLTFDPRADTVRVVFVDGVSGQTAGDQTLRFGS